VFRDVFVCGILPPVDISVFSRRARRISASPSPWQPVWFASGRHEYLKLLAHEMETKGTTLFLTVAPVRSVRPAGCPPVYREIKQLSLLLPG